MGHPSDQRLSARRPGKHERMRVKKPFRGQVWTWLRDHATGDLVPVHVVGGKKKMREAMRAISRRFQSRGPSTRDAQRPRKPQLRSAKDQSQAQRGQDPPIIIKGGSDGEG